MIIDLFILNILYGVFGGAIRGFVGVSKAIKGKKKIQPLRLVVTVLIAAVVGGVASAIADGDWRVGLLAGYAGSDLLEALYKTRLFGAIILGR